MPLYGGATRALACSGVNLSLQLGGYYTGDVNLIAPTVAGAATHYLPDLTGYLVATNNETVNNQGTLSGKIYNQQIQNLTITNNNLQNSTISGVSLGLDFNNITADSTLLLVDSSYNSTGVWNGSSEQIFILPEIGAGNSASNSDITVDEYGRITSIADGTPPDPPSFSGTTLYSLSTNYPGTASETELYPWDRGLYFNPYGMFLKKFDGSSNETLTMEVHTAPRYLYASSDFWSTLQAYGPYDVSWDGSASYSAQITPFANGPYQYASLVNTADGVLCDNVYATQVWNVGLFGITQCNSLVVNTDSASKPDTDTWTIASDSRIKTVLHPYVKGLSAIKQLNPVVYRLNGKFGSKDDGKDHVSVIAQEILSSWPEMVGTYTYKEKSENGEEIETQIYNINASDIMWALVNAFKELSLEIENLTSRIFALEEKNKK